MSGAATAAVPLECRALGEFSVLADGEVVDIGGPKQRLLLAVLLSRANATVRTDELVQALWHGRPPRTARKNLQAYVSRLRRIFGARLTHVGIGYRLRMTPDECDLLLFEDLVRSGRQASRDGDTETARRLLGRALAGWDGSPLAEFGDQPVLATARDRLQELFLSALEDWAELETESDGHRAVLDRLEEHVRQHALRERLAAGWMRALALSGRPNEALAHFDFVRRVLAEELGVQPGPMLSRLHARLLDGEVADPPPHRFGRGRPGNQLPRDLPDFVGRAAEVQRLIAHYGRSGGHNVAVVSGPVGVGKSCLAVHVAHRLVPLFPDGGLFAELGDRPLETVVRNLLDTIGLDVGHSPAYALATWRSWIAGRRLLLVLDDAVREDVVRRLLPSGGASAVIVTSRNRLSGLESVLRVDLPVLGQAESMELLGRVIGVGRVMTDPGSARRLVACCEGSPLAVRITGARLNALRHVRLADYADRLCRAPRLLDEMAAGELALRDRFESFYRGLSERRRAAFHRVVALEPPLEHGQLVAALSGLEEGAELALESLVECNLLMVPDAEVSAHSMVYGMSGFAYGFGRELGSRCELGAPSD
ncbi:AfsR/SARP family transcriptional regulator [Streptomyces sp.]|uniref:AfsR/SARP family transcriptional regulator n=1 Tax=Streptomyces sp. TaxID=1931 RepID=UPI002F3E507A